ISAEEWYTDAGVFAANRSLEDFERRLKQAAAEGYQGVRASGDASWLPMRDWARFQDYERELHRRVLRAGPSVRILCTYPLDRCQTPECIEVFCNHGSTLLSKSGLWQQHAGQGPGTTSETPLWGALMATLNEPLVELDANGAILRCNPAA